MARKKKLLVEKRNILNDIIAREFTLQECRLFSIYLGRINARDSSTRVVRLGIKQFYKAMDLHPQNEAYLKEIARGFLTKVVFMPIDGPYKDDFTAFQLFKRCKITHDARGNRYFEIDAQDDALPLLFDYQKDYFTYELWNVLNLESVNQVRMYEILKQNEYRGERLLGVDELKALLGIGEKEYPRWNNFKQWVLDACQKALKEKTDLSFTYEPIRTGRGGKITALQFVIAKNSEHVDKLNLESFIEPDMLAAAKQKPVPVPPNVSGLDFIIEPITAADKQSILQAADGVEALVRTAYDMAKQQGNIDNLTAWLIKMVKKIQNGEVTQPVKVKAPVKKSRFCNFEGRVYDYAELERMELEQLKADMAK